MKTGFKLALTLSALSLMFACGPADPSNSVKGNNDDNSDNNTNPNNTNPNNTNPNNTNPNNTNPNNTNPNNTNPNNTNPNNTNPNGQPGECLVSDTFFGQITSNSDEHAGGAPSTAALTTDAGLAGALAEFTAVEDEAQEVTIDITGATVIATNFGGGGNTNFWIQDSGAAMQVFLGFTTVVDFTVNVGDVVNFTITEFNNFDGAPQISKLENLTVEDTGTEVPYTALTGQAVTMEHYNKNVQIGGRLSGGEACGGQSTCYTLTHGTETIEFRSSSTFIGDGSCVTFFGPLGAFPGPNADSGNTPKVQLNTTNFSWYWQVD